MLNTENQDHHIALFKGKAIRKILYQMELHRRNKSAATAVEIASSLGK